MSIAVVADSSSSLPAALATAWGVRIVPLQVIVDGASHAEGDIAPATVVSHLTAGDEVATSQPAPEAFAAAFRDAVEAGATGVVVVTLAEALSGTAGSARAAAREAAVPVEVIDSGSVAMGAGFAALAAAAVAREGGTLEACATAARDTAASVRCVFTVDSLDHLRRGGRISPAIAAVGKVLGIRPLLEVSHGALGLIDRVRTTTRARAALLGLVDEAIAARSRPAVAILSVGDEALRDDAADDVAGRHASLVAMVRAEASAVLAVHAGPGTLAGMVAQMPEAWRALD